MARKQNLHRRGSSWVVRFRRDGRQVWQSFDTKDAAERFLAEGMVRKAQAQPEPALRTIRLERFADEWLTDHRIRVSEQTYVNYESVLRVHVLPSLGQLELRQITRKTLDSFVSDWATGGPLFQERARSLRAREAERARAEDRPPRHIRIGNSPKTVSNGIVVLCAMLGRAVEWGYLAVNPASNLRRPRDDRQAGELMHPLDADAVRALLEATDGQFARTLVMTAVMTGMRRGEVLALTWGDVDWRRNRIHVRRSIGLNGQAKQPKTRRSVRAIALTPTLVSELRRHRLASSFSGEEDLIFASKRGTPLDGRNMVRELFDPAVRRAGLPRMRFHDLRHSFASLLIAQGAHPKYISEQLGHASAQITMDRYSHLFDQSYSDESDKLE